MGSIEEINKSHELRFIHAVIHLATDGTDLVQEVDDVIVAALRTPYYARKCKAVEELGS